MNSAAKIPNPKIYLELIRPFTLIAPAVGFLSGSVIASRQLPGLNSYMGALAASLLNGASNVINQYFDLEIDKINKPQRPYPCGKISGKQVLLFAFFLYLCSLGISLLISPRLFVIMLLAALVSFFYSSPPLRIKKYTFLSNIFIAVSRGMLLIVAGWSVSRPIFSLEPWFIGLIFALFLVGAATTKDFSDIKGDSRFGIKTLPVLYGPEKASLLISPFFYLPFLLIPLGIFSGILPKTAFPLILLAFWGVHTCGLIKKNPQSLVSEKNHVSWIHMYLMLVAGQVGFAIAYLLNEI